MNIKKSITKKVNDTLKNTKQVLVDAIIDMMKDLGVEECSSMLLTYPVALTSTKMRPDGLITTETNLVNSVGYMQSNNSEFILCEYNVNKNVCSSSFMEIPELIALYNAVKFTIKQEQDGTRN